MNGFSDPRSRKSSSGFTKNNGAPLASNVAFHEVLQFQFSANSPSMLNRADSRTSTRWSSNIQTQVSTAVRLLRQSGATRRGTHLINHVRQQALYFILFHHFFRLRNAILQGSFRVAASCGQPDCGCELLDWDPRLPDALVFVLPVLERLEASGNEDLAEQVTERNIPATLKSEVYAAFHKLGLSSRESGIEGSQIALFDCSGQGSE